MNSSAEWLLSPELSEKLASPSQLDEAFLEGLRPDPDLTISQWADAYRVLPSESAAEYGQWRTSRVPYMREITDAQSPTHPCTESSLMKGTQIGASEAMYNIIGFCVHLCPCPGLLVMPTVDMAKLVSKQRIQTMLDSTPILADLVAAARSRDSGNTVLLKKYRGGIQRMTGANSGPGLRNMPVRYLLEDEIDAYPTDVGGEGDPCGVAEKRTTNFGSRKKIFRASSPKLKGSSRIHRYYLAGTQARYYVPCPHCAHEQWLRWAQMRYTMHQGREFTCRSCGGVNPLETDSQIVCGHCSAAGNIEQVQMVESGEVERVWYECESCQGEIDERRHKTQMLERGRHIHHVPGPGQFLADDDPHPWAIWVKSGGAVRRFLPTYQRPLSWHVSGLYSPLGWFAWAEAAKDFLESQKGGFDDESGESLAQVFSNTALGEPYEVEGEQAEANVLALRAEPYDLGRVPAGGLMLTAFADIQGNRIEYEVKAWGRDYESWLVDYQVLNGDPTNSADKVWDDLIELRNKAYAHAGGNSVYVAALGVDSGYMTQVVYDFCRKWQRKHVFATKGVAGPGKSAIGPERRVDYNHNGKAVRHGARLRVMGVDTLKERVFQALAVNQPGPGFMHFPRGLPTEYFEGLTSEKKIPRRKKGAIVYEYVKTRERNEPLDLEVGNHAVFIYAGGQRVNWDDLERRINPQQRDIFAAPVEAKPVHTSAPGESEKATNRDDATASHQSGAAADAAPGAEASAPGADAVGGEKEVATAASRKNWLNRRDDWLRR
jgi:phage terminase large subunit GpA-like protein